MVSAIRLDRAQQARPGELSVGPDRIETDGIRRFGPRDALDPTYSRFAARMLLLPLTVIVKRASRTLGKLSVVLFSVLRAIPYLGQRGGVDEQVVGRQSLSPVCEAVFPIEFVPMKFVCAALSDCSVPWAFSSCGAADQFVRQAHSLPCRWRCGPFALCLGIAWVYRRPRWCCPNIAQSSTSC